MTRFAHLAIATGALFAAMPDTDTDALLLAESEAQARVIRRPNQVEAVMADGHVAGEVGVWTQPSSDTGCEVSSCWAGTRDVASVTAGGVHQSGVRPGR